MWGCCCSASNRYGRAIDRARAFLDELEHSDPASARSKHLEEQLEHTHQRARLLRASMTYASASILLIALTIISLFFEQLFRFDRDLVAVPFFALCVLCLVVAMYYLIRDITVSLVALELHKQSVARMRDKPGTPPTRA